MDRKCLLLLVLTVLVLPSAISDNNELYSTIFDRRLPDVCYPPSGTVPWIIYHRHSDFGWKEHTHRANIALAVNHYQGNKTEMEMMELQLEVEIAKALLGKEKILENDLALFIHALVATNKNPRNFHGRDLVGDLLAQVDDVVNRNGKVHPFLVLALCNSYAIQPHHLVNLKHLTAHRRFESTEETNLKALALKAYACAASLRKKELQKFGKEMEDAVKCLRLKQTDDGDFGNAYTTAVAVQAMIASPLLPNWKKDAAMDYLLNHSVIRVNMIKVYYIELALHAEQVKFIKDLYNGPPMVPETPPVKKDFIQYTVRADVRPHIYHTITIQFEEGWTFYDVMSKCVQEGFVFNFDHYLTNRSIPMIHSVSGIPNDAEEDMFWRICLHRLKNSDSSIYEWKTFKDSPVNLKLNSDDKITFWYRSSDCA